MEREMEEMEAEEVEEVESVLMTVQWDDGRAHCGRT